MKRTLWLSLMLMFLTGCATGHHATLREINRPETSLLFGYMDMSAAPSKMDYFQMKNFPAYDTYYEFETDKGFFYDEAVPPGSYQLDEFGGTSTVLLFFNISHYYTFLNPDAKFRITTPSMYYLGSFKYVPDKDNFNIIRSKTPTEGDLLQRLLPKVRGTKWEDTVLQRLRTLGISSTAP